MNAVRHFRLVALVFAACALSTGAFHVSQAAAQEAQPTPAASASPGTAVTPPDPEKGKLLFAQNCSSCHGADAGGGDGPNLHGVAATLGELAMQGIIRRGIEGTAMPGSATLSEKQIANIAAYIEKFDSAANAAQAPGDSHKGEALYNFSGCSACHMINGQGGSIGPELTRIGAARGPTNLKARLLDPGANLPQMGDGPFGSRWTQYLMYRAVEKDGRVVEGVRVGEDSFTIVLKDAAGKLHGFRKPDLRSLEKEPGKSFMPSFKDALSAAQLDDLVAYLMTLKGAQ